MNWIILEILHLMLFEAELKSLRTSHKILSKLKKEQISNSAWAYGIHSQTIV